MLPIDIEIKGNKELSKKYAERSREMKNVRQRIVSKVALSVERYGKLYSPVKTGRMRASIIPVEINEMSARVGPQVDYAPYVHKRIPFMWAAREDAQKDVEQIVKTEVRKALE